MNKYNQNILGSKTGDKTGITGRHAGLSQRDLPQRKSIRLKKYDYSQTGLYFTTICTQNRKHLFGTINNQKMTLNAAGTMVKKWYFELTNKFNNIQCHEIIIMPNHIHFIIQPAPSVPSVPPVGADLRVCPPDNGGNAPPDNGGNGGNGQTHRSAPTTTETPSLNTVVQWFKTMTTNEYIRGVNNNIFPPFNKRMWQRNYWEHIIRNENEYNRIAQYIDDNPKKWEDDTLNNGLDNIVMEPHTLYGEERWTI